MELRRRCEELEAQLKAKEEENTELMHELEQKNAMISVLENTIKEREKKYLEELKLKSHKLAVLSGELEQRAGTIAYLTAQLHATKKRLLAGSSSDGSPTASPVSSYKPTPPPKDRQPETPRRRMKKSLSQPLHSEYAELYRLGADGRRLVLRDALDAMPDPTPFLQAREAAEAQVPRERPAVIPPIGAARERSPAPPAPPSGASPRHSPARHTRTHVGVAHRIHRAAPPAAQPESPTVDPVDDTKMANKQPGADRTV
ncbi:coiled-coil domain-containing protein 92 isoform X2 [Scleropages formosus]|nr:coiled-coil domain-containing protein 92 isoform X2 [Scleropages formosus]